MLVQANDAFENSSAAVGVASAELEQKPKKVQTNAVCSVLVYSVLKDLSTHALLVFNPRVCRSFQGKKRRLHNRKRRRDNELKKR